MIGFIVGSILMALALFVFLSIAQHGPYDTRKNGPGLWTAGIVMAIIGATLIWIYIDDLPVIVAR